MTLFQVATGSVPGRTHLLAGRPNQDAVAWLANADTFVGVVCDGCSSAAHSQIGAALGARLLAQGIFAHLNDPLGGRDSEGLFQGPLEAARRDLLAQLRLLGRAMGNSLSAIVVDYFLFTATVLVADHQATAIYLVGDGCYGLDEALGSERFPDNAPPYLAYDGLVATSYQACPEVLAFRRYAAAPTEQVAAAFIGSDGVLHLIEACQQGRRVPGTEEPIAPFGAFWRDEALFRNPDILRRRLARLTHRAQDGHPLLPDDTTLVAVRRPPAQVQPW